MADTADPSRKRMIEDEIPLAQVNYHAAKEKKHPRRFVELIHQWPARRPRSASRVAIAAALLSAPTNDAEKTARIDLLERLSPYECDASALQEARALIRAEHGGRASKVLDIFAGGGAIPLEAANLGCDAHAVELNPVAHLIELATCVYPQKYGPKLADLVEVWGQKVLKEVRTRIGDLHPSIRIHGEKLVEPVAYLWTRTVPCTNRTCDATVPLVRQTWLCKKRNRAIALRMIPDRALRRVHFEVVSAKSAAELGFDPADLSDRGDSECLFCGATIDASKVKEYGKTGRIDVQLMAVAGMVEGSRGRVYLAPDVVALPSRDVLQARLHAFATEWPGPAAIKMPIGDSLNFKLPLYGINTFAEMFTDRQAISLLALTDAIHSAYKEIISSLGDSELAKAIITYLALAQDKYADHGTAFARWHSGDQKMVGTFSRQALAMVWDFAEINPLASVGGSFEFTLLSEVDAIRGLATVPGTVTLSRGTATELPYATDSIDCVITDPPYYDNISYSDLSDFFYIWLRRTLGSIYPEHLTSEQTPKQQEAVVTPHRHGGNVELARGHYQRLMTAAFQEAGRVVKPGGPVVVVYAHKTVAGWATAVDSLCQAGCLVTEAWPLRTESETRLNARDTAALATSIFLVARKRAAEKICNDYDAEVLPLTHRVVEKRAAMLWAQGVTGADLIIAVIGAALGPFTEFSTVRRANGSEVKSRAFLEEAQRMALDAILRKMIHTADEQTDAAAAVNAIDPISRLYVVVRLQFGEAMTDDDVFKNLASGTLPPGMNADELTRAPMLGKSALLAKQGSKVGFHTFAERGSSADLGLFADGKPAPLIDVLHRLLWLQKNRRSQVAAFLKECRADLETVRRLAQALGGRPLRAEPTPGAPRYTRTEEQRAIDTFLARSPV